MRRHKHELDRLLTEVTQSLLDRMHAREHAPIAAVARNYRRARTCGSFRFRPILLQAKKGVGKLVALDPAALLVHEFQMAKGQRESGLDLIQSRSVIGSLFPPCARQANLRAMCARAQQSAAAGVPPEKESCAIRPPDIPQGFRRGCRSTTHTPPP